MVGPTGSGKSTLLNMAAGLLAPSTGTVEVFGEDLARAPDGINRRAGYMFQTESLMPWRTALSNVMAGLEFRGVAPDDARAQAEAWLQRVGLGGFGDRYPHQLSGGMRKRTSLAQVLALDPDIILMDEPFSALDIQTRQLMENEVLELVVVEEKGGAVHHPRPRRGDRDERPRRDSQLGTGGAADRRIRHRPAAPARCRRDQGHGANFSALHSAIWAVLRDEVLKAYQQQLKGGLSDVETDSSPHRRHCGCGSSAC